MWEKKMDEGFKGLLPAIQEGGVEFIYKPELDNFSWYEQVIKAAKHSRREPVIYVGGYAYALIRGDKDRIAHYELMYKIEKIKKYRGYIQYFGIKHAKVLAYLDKKYKANIWTNWMWYVREPKLQYRGIGLGEMESVWFVVRMKDNNKFQISVHANDSDGWTPDLWSPILKENISYSSVINILNYYLFKSKNGNL